MNSFTGEHLTLGLVIEVQQMVKIANYVNTTV